MTNQLKSFAVGACALTNLISTNAIVVGCLMMNKDFISASASTLLNTMRENKLQALASVAIVPSLGLAAASFYSWVAYKGLFKSDDVAMQETINEINNKCRGNLYESLKLMPSMTINSIMKFLGYTYYLVQPIIHQHYADPNKGMFSNLWNAEKNYAIGVCKAAFSPKTAPLFSTLSMIQGVSMLAMFALSSGGGQERN